MRNLLLIGAALVCAAPVAAQAPDRPDREIGILLVAHGADSAWNAGVETLARSVRASTVADRPVGTAFLMGPEAPRHRFQDVVDTLVRAGARTVVIVPVLASSHSGHYEQLRYLAGATDSLDAEMAMHLHAAGITRAAMPVPLTLTLALDDAPELAHVIAARALALAPTPAGSALFIFGHGPNSAEAYAAWMENLRPVAEAARREAGFTTVGVELVRDDAPPSVRTEAVRRAREIIGWLNAATGREVVVVPLLVSAGDISRRRLPEDLAGLPIVYSGQPLLPDSSLAEWVLRRVREADTTRRVADPRPTRPAAPARVH